MATGDRLFIADKETLDVVNSKLDTLAALESKLDQLIRYDASGNVLGLKIVKSIQFKEVTLEGGNSATINHNTVDSSKTIILLDASDADNTTNYNSRTGVRIFDKTDTSFKLISFAATCRVFCQIVEFY